MFDKQEYWKNRKKGLRGQGPKLSFVDNSKEALIRYLTAEHNAPGERAAKRRSFELRRRTNQ